ncbi:hypothetical protein CFC21_015470 [Triticum aestivum]|uniref:F-box domain-containing protein n=3 Tax=Triticum TaxID=4564 RepID=A0A9R1R375_TRITD|nr:F-box protein At5g07610-like isoform X2 [Triticum dicoccoides]XP_044455355.1 F-box protein At5g07610-like isoform X2 [Triticum aestivum]KAF6999441.1 hypothetical protein CFC21_015470 [Triticum aestivum]VAH26587.1 unnamed protein product [Triticum turgidum subsp. durum]
MNRSKNGATSVADLTDDLIIEILSLLPVKSVCRFKCVSRLWYSLISHPEHRKRLPQTISGFFYPKHRLNDEQIFPKDCCNGLIFCLCWKDSPIDEADYVVCNPATEEWVVLPDAGHKSDAIAYRLGFDGAMSLHFHVFQILEDDEDYGYISGVNIYSSETGAWSYKENGWGDNEIQIVEMRGLFQWNDALAHT